MLKNGFPHVQSTLGGQTELVTSSLNRLKLLIDWFCSQTDSQIWPDVTTGGTPPWSHPSPPGAFPLTRTKNHTISSSSFFYRLLQIFIFVLFLSHYFYLVFISFFTLFLFVQNREKPRIFIH